MVSSRLILKCCSPIIILFILCSAVFGFVKTYRLQDLSYGYDIKQTSDGNVILCGTTQKDSGMANSDGFIAKLDNSGKIKWANRYQSFGIAKNKPDPSSPGYEDFCSALDLGDNYAFGGTILGFADEKYLEKKEMWDDYFFTLFDKSGKHVLSKMMGGYNQELDLNLVGTDTDGFYISGSAIPEGLGEVADTDAAPHFSVLGKFDLSGNIQWLKKLSAYPARIKRTNDGNFIALVNVKKSTESSDSSRAMTDIPIIAKINGNGEILWAKSIEGLPMNLKSAVINQDGKIESKNIKMRFTAGVFREVVPLALGGYLVVGRLDAYNLTSRTAPKMFQSKIVGIKFSENGSFEWAGFFNFENMLCGNVLAVNLSDGNIALGFEYYNTSVQSKVFIAKLTPDFSFSWGRTIGDKRVVRFGGMSAGINNAEVLVTGQLETKDLNFILFNEKHFYKDVLLVTFDSNGGVGETALVSDLGPLSTHDASPQIYSSSETFTIEDYVFTFDKKVSPKITAQKTIVKNL